MIFVFAAWACIFMAIVLSWLWLQSLPVPRHGTNCTRDDSHIRATRTTLRSLALLSALSLAFLCLHFVLPEREAQSDEEWTAHTALHGANHTSMDSARTYNATRANQANHANHTNHANHANHTNHTIHTHRN